MITNRSTFFLGLFIVLLATSFLAVPSSWRTFFIVVSGLVLMAQSVEFSAIQKSLLPPRPKVKPRTRSKMNPSESTEENIPEMK